VRKLVGKGPHGRPRCWMEENIKMDLKEMGWRKVCTELIWLRAVARSTML